MVNVLLSYFYCYCIVVGLWEYYLVVFVFGCYIGFCDIGECVVKLY